MKIKICGLTRDEDIDYVNESRPDYIGFVFAKSKRQVSPVMAQYLRFRLANGITPVGVFVDAPVKEIAELYKNGVISIAQLHGNEDEAYILRLKEVADGIPVIKAVKIQGTGNREQGTGVVVRNQSLKPTRKDIKQSSLLPTKADYLLFDSGAGSGKTFDWNLINSFNCSLLTVPCSLKWFLAGGIDIKNIEKAMQLKPFAIDVSSGVETNGLKDRKKILELVSIIKKES